MLAHVEMPAFALAVHPLGFQAEKKSMSEQCL